MHGVATVWHVVLCGKACGGGLEAKVEEERSELGLRERDGRRVLGIREVAKDVARACATHAVHGVSSAPEERCTVWVVHCAWAWLAPGCSRMSRRCRVRAVGSVLASTCVLAQCATARRRSIMAVVYSCLPYASVVGNIAAALRTYHLP